ncbi:MAG: LysR family transcriptional regulator [Burkholderiaceae bacterium]
MTISRLTLTKLRGFAAVAEHGNFRAAANALSVSQPALSAHVAELEEMLGVPLFHRTTQRVELTDEGARLQAKVHRILRELETIEDIRQEAQLQRGRITVSFLPSLATHLFPQSLANYSASYPNISVSVIDEPADRMVETIRLGNADFGIGSEPLDLEGFRFEKLAEEPYSLICRSDDPLSKAASIPAKALSDLDLVVVRSSPNAVDYLTRFFSAIGTPLKPRYTVNFHYTLGGLVHAGIAHGCLPSLGLGMTGISSLVAVPIVKPRGVRTIGVLMRNGDNLSPAAQAFLKVVKEVLHTQKLGLKGLEGSRPAAAGHRGRR